VLDFGVEDEGLWVGVYSFHQSGSIQGFKVFT